MGAGIVWSKCSCRVAQSGQRSCTSRLAQSWELRNLSEAVAQAKLRNPTSCASRVVQSWKSHKRSCAILEVAQAKFRNPSCAIRPKCCTILVAQSGEVAESDFIPYNYINYIWLHLIIWLYMIVYDCMLLYNIYIYLDLHSDINFCLFNIICLKGVSDRKFDCGRNSVSTIGNIEMLYFWGKWIRAELHVIRAETHVIQA